MFIYYLDNRYNLEFSAVQQFGFECKGVGGRRGKAMYGWGEVGTRMSAQKRILCILIRTEPGGFVV